MKMKEGWAWKVLLVIMIVVLLPTCQSTVVKKKRGIGPEGEKVSSKDMERKEREKKAFEESLSTKKYPGIEGTVIESTLLKDINFDFDKYDLTDEARKILADNAKLLEAHPNLRIQIEGHCDERGSNEYNLSLGEKRATGTQLYLIKLGVQGERLSTISYGEEMPLDSGHNEEAWAKNRRSHFIILSR